MKTGDKKAFALVFDDLDAAKVVDFIYVEGVGWVADRNVKTNISYAQLDELGYIKGKQITINGADYLCRTLKCLEWDMCIDYSDDDDLWHWGNVYSWVYIPDFERLSNRVFRGYYGASSWNNRTASIAYASLGWRPVLEALNSGTPTNDIGECTTVKNPELLPCLFCGGEALINVVEPHTHKIATFMPDYPGGAFVECGGCSVGISGDNEQAAVAAWNERT